MKLGQQLLGAHISPSQCNSTFHKPQEVDASCSTRVVERKNKCIGGLCAQHGSRSLADLKTQPEKWLQFWLNIDFAVFFFCTVKSCHPPDMQFNAVCLVLCLSQHVSIGLMGPLKFRKSLPGRRSSCERCFGARYGHVF